MDIRRALPGDVEQLVGLENACFDSSVAIRPRQWRRFIRQSPCPVKVISESGRIVADAIIVIRHNARGRLGWMYSLAVDPQWRGRGLGKKLLNRCIAESKKSGAYAIVLQVDVGNFTAIKLYESAGFRREGLLADYYGHNCPGLKMRLRLKPEV